CWGDVVDVLCNLVGDFHHRGGVVPNVLVAIDGFDLVGVSLLAVIVLMSHVLVSFMPVSLVVVLVAMVMVVGGQRKRVDDRVLIVERRVKPSIISTAADHDDICFMCARHVRGRRFKMVLVHVIALHQRGDSDMHGFG